MPSDSPEPRASDGQDPRGLPATGMPSISLPKGGGAISGMGEKIAANPVTGTSSTTVPIAVSPGRSGFGPQLTLSCDSAADNGAFGFGWNLPLSAIDAVLVLRKCTDFSVGSLFASRMVSRWLKR